MRSVDPDDVRRPPPELPKGAHAATVRCRGLRLRHQAQYPATAGEPGCRVASCRPPRRPPKCWRSSRTACSSPTAPATRRPCTYAIEAMRGAARQGADLRHLPGPPNPGAGAGRQNLQDEVRPPRRQPAGGALGAHRDRARNQQPQPRFCRESRQLCRPSVEITHVNLNDGCVEGLRGARSARVQRAISPGGIARPARRQLPVRRIPARHAGLTTRTALVSSQSRRRHDAWRGRSVPGG